MTNKILILYSTRNCLLNFAKGCYKPAGSTDAIVLVGESELFTDEYKLPSAIISIDC